MLDTTIIQQGTFTKTNTNDVYLAIRSDVDWMYVYNYTNAAQNGDANLRGSTYYWQRGMAAATGMTYYKDNGGAGLNLNVLATPNGFTLTDSSIATVGAATALTAITANAINVAPAVTSAALPAVGDIVRFDNLDNQPQIGGIDFTVSASGGGTFSIGNISMRGSVASTAGNWRLIQFNPIFYPRRRTVTFCRAAASAVIYLSVTHQFTVGQQVRLEFPGGNAVWGDWAQLDQQTATITAVNVARVAGEPNNAVADNSITIDIDTSGYTAWATSFGAAATDYPTAGYVPYSPAQVVPIGEDTPTAILNAVDILGDATHNRAFLGMRLGGGTNSVGPAGTTNDVIYWVAGKSFSNSSTILTTL